MKTLKQKIDHKRKLIEKHQQELHELIRSCPHENTVDKALYSDGSYYDLAYTQYYAVCTTCGHRTELNRVTHSYYG